MAVIRLILLVAILGVLTLLLVQNWSPVLSLVFLGVRTQPLPLAMWVLLSTLAGAFTSLLILILLKLSNYFGKQQRPTPLKSPPRSARTTATSKKEPARQSYRPSPTVNQTETTSRNAFDDWETSDNDNDDWGFNEQPKPAPPPSAKTSPQTEPETQTYERQQEPISGSQSGSVYSYSYREPKNTAVGKTESVYDADYRVIIPPYQPPDTNQVDDDDDDWEFFEDDEFEDDDNSPRK